MAVQSMTIDLAIPADELERMYTGSARYVHCRARDGRTVRFPIQHLQPFVTLEGIYGVFVLEFDQQHKFKAMHKVG